MDSPSWLEPSEIIASIRTLTPGQKGLLLKKARNYSLGLTASGDDLLHEAFVRATVGIRKCPRDVNVVTFLINVMRSLASHARKKTLSPKEVLEDEYAEELIAGDEWSIEATIKAEEFLAQLESHFADDKMVMSVLSSRHDGWSKAETCELSGMTILEYEAAVRRLQRFASKFRGEDA